MDSRPIIVVSGLPRSGTSLMMQMLEAGGVPVYADGIRAADADNPRGYQETEAVKKLAEDSSWLGQVRGQAIKVVSMLLYHLPPQFPYKVIFMQREYGELLASQREMLRRRGTLVPGPADAAMQRHFEEHLAKVHRWLGERPNFQLLSCSYNRLLQDTSAVLRDVSDFLGSSLNTRAMAAAIEPGLYRNRGAAVADAIPVPAVAPVT